MKKRQEHIKAAAHGICAYLNVILRVKMGVCVCARARAHAYVCARVQLDVLGCAASQDAMREMSSKSGNYSDKGVFGAEEDFPLYTDKVRGTREGGDHL